MNDNATDNLTDTPRLAEGDKRADKCPLCEAAQTRIAELENLGDAMAWELEHLQSTVYNAPSRELAKTWRKMRKEHTNENR